MADVNVGAIDPVGVLHSQIGSMIALTEAFKSKGNIRPIDYLRAMHAARENVEAVITLTFSAVMSDAADQVPEDVYDTHTREMQESMLGQTEEERHERLHRALNRVAKHVAINTDDDDKPEKPDAKPDNEAKNEAKPDDDKPQEDI